MTTPEPLVEAFSLSVEDASDIRDALFQVIWNQGTDVQLPAAITQRLRKALNGKFEQNKFELFTPWTAPIWRVEVEGATYLFQDKASAERFFETLPQTLEMKGPTATPVYSYQERGGLKPNTQTLSNLFWVEKMKDRSLRTEDFRFDPMQAAAKMMELYSAMDSLLGAVPSPHTPPSSAATPVPPINLQLRQPETHPLYVELGLSLEDVKELRAALDHAAWKPGTPVSLPVDAVRKLKDAIQQKFEEPKT